MVTRRPGGTRGASKLGCLVSLVLFGAALYYGSQVGRVYWRYYGLVEEMKTAARFARNRTDAAIRADILARIDELGVPPEARQLVVRRSGPPMTILIRTEYREVLPLPPPIGARTIVFRPQVELRF